MTEKKQAPCFLCRFNRPHTDESTRIIGKDGFITCDKGLFEGKPFQPWKKYDSNDTELCGKWMPIGTSIIHDESNQPKK